MIRIHRGREPRALRPIRLAELARVRSLASNGTLNSTTIGSRYDTVKSVLCKAQHNKCCYCERNNLESKYLPVEHYRPKLEAHRGAGFPDHGYWWLSWTWGNLLFSCQVCNSSFKRSNFPLDAGSTALIAEQQPPGAERPMLIDPCTEDPTVHIKFTYHANLPSLRWRPLPRNGSCVGDETIRGLGLDRPELLDLYENHVDGHVTPIVNRLATAVAAGNRSTVTAIWRHEVTGWLNSERPFTALSYDALDHFFPQAVRRKWGLRLLRPS